jgi:hypothetical protein
MSKGRDAKDVLATEACEQSEIDVASYARFAPALYGDSSDKTEAPAIVIAENLEFACGFEKTVHRGSLANQNCISTSPDEGRGGRVLNA